MKQFFGSIIFVLSIAALISEAHKYSYDIPWWILVITLVAIGWSLEMLINGLIDDAKQELRDEINELRDKIRK